MGHIAIVTQSYKDDYRECKLLCESIDRFTEDLDHFIFVNDEDVKMFQDMNYDRHRVFPKSTILPRYMIRIPWRIMGHHFHVSPITIPVREWIVQQICKLGVFEVIGPEYDAVFNIDSESILMRPLDISHWIHKDKYLMYHVDNSISNEPNQSEYIDAAKRLLKLDDTLSDGGTYSYMSTPTCFVRSNMELLLKEIKSHSLLRSWKWSLCNTYRFSENYTYGIYTRERLAMSNHFNVDYRPFVTIDIAECPDAGSLNDKIRTALADTRTDGVLLQKSARKRVANKYLNFDDIERTVKRFWSELQ